MKRYPDNFICFVQPDDAGQGGDTTLQQRIEDLILTAPTRYKRQWRLICFLVGQNNSELVKTQLMPRLDYLNYRTGEKIHVVCVGFGHEYVPVEAKRFVEAVAWLEAHCPWKYSGETDLLLMNAQVRGAKVQLQSERVVAFTLEHALTDQAIKSVPNFIERMIRFSEDYTGDDPTWGFSDEQARLLGCSALKALLLNCLPKSSRKSAKAAFYFCVKELPSATKHTQARREKRRP